MTALQFPNILFSCVCPYFEGAFLLSYISVLLIYAYNFKLDKTQSKCRRKTPEANNSMTKNVPTALLNQWTTEDDIALIAAITHVMEKLVVTIT